MKARTDNTPLHKDDYGLRETPAGDSRGVLNAFTVDFEDWYQGIELPRDSWDQYEERLELSGGALLDLLKEYKVKATFFVLGHNARRYPHLMKRIVDDGHNIGSHGDSHEYIYKMTSDEFRDDLARSIESIEKASGVKPISYRAPFFSITKDSLWALDDLKDYGIKYDSSMVPVDYYRYGIPDCPRGIHSPTTCEADGSMIEFPISTAKILGKTLPISGGTYFRILPYRIVRDRIRKLNNSGKPIIFYIHPWEIDPDQPRISLPRRVGIPHYANLAGTLPKLKRLFNDFKFGPMEEVVKLATN